MYLEIIGEFGIKSKQTSYEKCRFFGSETANAMIKKLDFSDLKILGISLKIQHEAYEVEAQLIGSRNIPPLHETIEQLKEVNEIFWGYFDGDELIGFVSVEDEDRDLRISRLVVRPKFFSKGIGTQLVQHVLKNLRNGRSVIVSTGNGNLPAKRLYEKFGFSQKRIFEIDGIKIAEFKFQDF